MLPKLAFIGLGNMGLPMAKRLLEAGYSLTVYNRTAAKAAELVASGATSASTPKGAAAGANILVTMLSEDQALESVMTGETGALQGLNKDAIHLSMSTISPSLVKRLHLSHSERGQHFVGAPVFGRPPAAAAGKLFIVASGDAQVIKQCSGVFKILGQQVTNLGADPAQAPLAKVLGNFMLLSVIESLAEAIALARKAGLNERDFLDAMTTTIFTAPIYKNYGTMIVEQAYSQETGFKLPLALKDIKLALSVADQQQTPMPLASLLRDHILTAIGRGDGELDMSALGKLAADNAGL